MNSTTPTMAQQRQLVPFFAEWMLGYAGGTQKHDYSRLARTSI
jgi:hypothetical protein